MKTFILIHGSWHNECNWHKVTPLLEQTGHKAIAIDLSATGRDKTPIAEVTLKASVDKICSAIDSIEDKVILVGHSNNAIMISQAAEYRPQKIEKLVYLAAYLIPNGKTQREYSLQDTDGMLKTYITFHESTKPQTEIYKVGSYASCDDYITELSKMLLNQEPFESAITPPELTEENFGTVPIVYSECIEDRVATPFTQRKMYTELPC